MNMNDIRTKSQADLTKELREKQESLRAFRFGEAGARTRDVKAGRRMRREIAQILTELNARVAKMSENA